MPDTAGSLPVPGRAVSPTPRHGRLGAKAAALTPATSSASDNQAGYEAL